jgi:hypothetical protein
MVDYSLSFPVWCTLKRPSDIITSTIPGKHSTVYLDLALQRLTHLGISSEVNSSLQNVTNSRCERYDIYYQQNIIRSLSYESISYIYIFIRCCPQEATWLRHAIEKNYRCSSRERQGTWFFFLEVPSEPDYDFHRADVHAPHRRPIGMTAKSFGGALVPRFIGMSSSLGDLGSLTVFTSLRWSEPGARARRQAECVRWSYTKQCCHLSLHVRGVSTK